MDQLEDKINKAITAYKLGNIEEADILFEKIACESSDDEDVLLKIFKVYYKLNEFDKAITYIQKVLKINPDPRYYNALGNIYYDRKDYLKAKECYIKVIKNYPDNAECLFRLGIASNYTLQYEEAEAYLKKVITLEPNHDITYFNLALTYKSLAKLDKSYECIVKSLELNPNSPAAVTFLAKLLLQAGNFSKGWELYDARFYKSDGINRVDSEKPEWDGSSLEGKTMYIKREQGFGDCIMTARYILLLTDMGAKVLFEPHSELVQLFKDSNMPIEFIEESSLTEDLDFDTHITTMSLPRVFNANENNIPFSEGYLKANPEKVEKYKKDYFNNEEFKIGIVWQCKNVFYYDLLRSLPDLSYLYPIAKIPGVKLYSLQKGEGEEQLKNIPDDVNITDLGKTFNDFSDTAAAIENLDLVVTIDTGVAHLAGAMGKDSIILLECVPDWRWLLNRDNSIWYKKVKLFRQTKPLDWEGVIERVTEYIQKTLN